MKEVKKKRYDQLHISDKKKIVELYYKHLSFKEIKDAIGCSGRAVKRVLVDDFNINTRRKRRYTLNEEYFSTIDKEDKAYILGYMIADGFVDKSTNNIVMQIQEDDGHLLYDIAKLIEFSGEVRYIAPQKNRYSNKGAYILNFSSDKMVKDLYRLGLYRNKSLTMSELPNIDKNLIRHLIRGVFDGDGSITVFEHNSDIRTLSGGRKVEYERSPYISIIGTKPFLSEVRECLISGSGCSPGCLSPSKTNELLYLMMRGNRNLEKIYHFLYDDSTIFLKRKHDKFKRIKPLREETLARKSG